MGIGVSTRVVMAAAIAVLASRTAATQTAVLVGTVLRDTLGHELPGSEVMLPDLKRGTTANFLGVFRLDRLPTGRVAMVIRHVGFAPLYDTLDITDGARLEREFTLLPQATQLDSVRVTAPEKKYISPGLQGFEERRKQGFGHFITEDEMRKNDDHRLVDVISSRVPGVSVFRVPKTDAYYLTSKRKCGDGPAILGCNPGHSACPPTMYLDGSLYFNPAGHDSDAIPDLGRLNTREIAAVEFYAGGATTPAKYNQTTSDCGVLLIWTRER